MTASSSFNNLTWAKTYQLGAWWLRFRESESPQSGFEEYHRNMIYPLRQTRGRFPRHGRESNINETKCTLGVCTFDRGISLPYTNRMINFPLTQHCYIPTQASRASLLAAFYPPVACSRHIRPSFSLIVLLHRRSAGKFPIIQLHTAVRHTPNSNCNQAVTTERAVVDISQTDSWRCLWTPVRVFLCATTTAWLLCNAVYDKGVNRYRTISYSVSSRMGNGDEGDHPAKPPAIRQHAKYACLQYRRKSLYQDELKAKASSQKKNK